MSAPVVIMLKLSGGHWVNALDISEVRADYDRRRLLVTMRDGAAHAVAPEYGESVSTAEDRLVSSINQAATAVYGRHHEGVH